MPSVSASGRSMHLFALGRCCVRDVGDHEEQKTGKVDGAAHVVGHRLQLGRCALDTEALHDSAQLHCGAVVHQATQGSRQRKRVGTPQVDGTSRQHKPMPSVRT